MNSLGESTSKKKAVDDFQSASGIVEKSKQKRPSPITLRLTTEERAKLEQLAQGMTFSAYIRACIFQSNASPRKRIAKATTKDKAALGEILGLLGQSRIANNLNQLAYNANTGSLIVNEDTLQQIEEAYDHTREMRDALVQAIGLKEKRH